MNYISVLKKPVISEKSFQSSTQSKFVFIVGADVTKTIVKQAFENLYDVSVKSVNMQILPRKFRDSGRKKVVRRSTQKRATITVAGDASSLDITKIKRS
ncbi:MAG: 50S ribosomal protein L23 [Patescibacteria group bacterium]|nr:50S ribosomal protein L23 [Patescibacteria group bacterium]